jgi:hypothetical protein
MPDLNDVTVEVVNHDGIVGTFTISPEVAARIRANALPGLSINGEDVPPPARPATTYTGPSGMTWPV